jgi:hypothetical protein
MTDYQEFVAGTDPTAKASYLEVLKPDILSSSRVRLSWTSVDGHAYRLWYSTNALDWAPFTSWLSGVSTQTSYTIPGLNGAPAWLFHVEVSP